MRKLAPKGLDRFTVSPVGNKAEFCRIFELAHAAYPGVELTYIGMNATHHYFQEHGVREAYLIARETEE